MNLTYYSKILFSLLLVSSLTMHAVKIEEIKDSIQNQQTKEKQQKIQLLPALKSSVKIVAGLLSLFATGHLYYKIIDEEGFKNFLKLPYLVALNLRNYPNESALMCGAYAWTGFGAYLLQSGIRDAYEIKKNQYSSKL